jgi:hypothetical protein
MGCCLLSGYLSRRGLGHSAFLATEALVVTATGFRGRFGRENTLFDATQWAGLRAYGERDGLASRGPAALSGERDYPEWGRRIRAAFFGHYLLASVRQVFGIPAAKTAA